MKLSAKIILFLVILAGGLVIARVALSSAFASDGITLAAMNQQIASLDRENMIMQEKLLTLSSYTHIASDAASEGFVDDASQISLNQATPIAVK